MSQGSSQEFSSQADTADESQKSASDSEDHPNFDFFEETKEYATGAKKGETHTIVTLVIGPYDFHKGKPHKKIQESSTLVVMVVGDLDPLYKQLPIKKMKNGFLIHGQTTIFVHCPLTTI